MSRISLFILSITCFINAFSQNYSPIIALEKPVIDTFFTEYIVTDNYRWMEKTQHPDVIQWVNDQNKMSDRYLARTTNKTNSKVSIDKYATTDFKNPSKKGDYYFTYAYYNSKFYVPALFYRNYLEARPEILVDPNFISAKDQITLKGYWVSGDSKYLAYQFSRNGSDRAELNIVKLGNGQHTNDYLEGLRYSNVAWRGNGFYYSTFPKTDQFGKAVGEQVFYHEVGTDQSEDELVFKRNNPNIQFSYMTTSDERYFVIRELNEDHGIYNIFYIDFNAEQPTLTPLLMNIDHSITIRDSYQGKFVATTAYQANNVRIIEIDPAQPMEWREIAPNYEEALLLHSMYFKDRILAIYQTNEHPVLTVMDYSGEILYSLELPLASSVSKLSGNWDDDEVLFSFSSYTIPPVVYKFNIRSFYKEIIQQTAVTFDFDKIVYNKMDCSVNDSLSIPMIVVHKDDMELNGKNPVILKTYGGFGSVEQPSFNPGIVHFIMDGGVFVFARTRGGGAKGLEWSEAGEREQKQNTIDDLISAAECLIMNKYTNPDQLAITGASHGGLIVAAAAMQRPNLFKAVVPIVAPLDLIRMEHFTVGSFHRDEFGTVVDSLDFVNLLSYSPYQNVQGDVNYPAMLLVTSENDDRVPPFHSYKFVALMQSRPAQTKPILLKVEESAGHYGAQTRLGWKKEMSDEFGFIMYEIMK